MRQRPQIYAITSVTYQRRSIFQRDALAELFLATLFRYRDAGRFLLHAFVVMPDHIHVLITPATDQTIERCAQFIKGGFSFAIRKDYPGEIWQTSYQAHRVIDADDLRNQYLYIMNNPTRKNFQDYPHVHTATRYAGLLDPLPEI